MRLLPVALSLAAFVSLSFAQQPPPPETKEADILKVAEREVTSIREGLAKKREAVANAISNAAKAGHLKASTEAYFRDTLEKFNAPEGTLPDLEAAYFPPRFDTSEEMEPVNLAWSDLRQEVTALKARVVRLHSTLLKAATDAILQSARALAKPESLDPVDKILSAMSKMQDGNFGRVFSSSSIEGTRTMSALVRAILDAHHKGDVAALVDALGGGGRGNPSFSYDAGGGLPFRSDALLDDLRARVTAPLLAAAQEAQRKVEQQIMSEQPLAEIEKAIRDFAAKAAPIGQLRSRARHQPIPDPERSSIAGAYRVVAQMVESLKSETPADPAVQFPDLHGDGSISVTPEFMAFISKLRGRLSDHRSKIVARVEAERQAEQRRAAEQARLNEQKQKQEFDAELRKMILTRTKEIGARILAVKSAEETLAFAKELTGTEGFGDERSDLSGPKRELLQLGTWWLNAMQAGNSTLEPTSGMIEQHPFSVEMKSLRDRAIRDVAVKQFKLPQLLQEPYAAMDVKAAVDKLSQEAAARLDWKQSYEILRVLAGPQSSLNSALNERLQATRSYLTAVNLESAEQYREAADAYLASIRAVGEHLPTVDAAARLRKMRIAHPEIFGPLKAEPKPRATARP